jgi:glycosyltransferase involved in cell wall biosynthesis
MCEIYGARRAEIAVVHNGIATSAPSTNRAGTSALTVLFVGRLVRFKRVDRLIHAVEKLGSDQDVRVLIVGRGPLEDDLRTLARDLGVDDRVHFLGWQEDMEAVWREADILVMPSAGEPFGLAMIEGAARGLVTVAFADGGGVLETVGPDGHVVQSVRELSETLRDLSGSSTLSQKARLARSAWTREKFAINSTAVRYLDLYKTASAE